MQTDITYLDIPAAVNAPVNMTASYVEVVGIDIVINLMIVISVLLTIITFYTIKRGLNA